MERRPLGHTGVELPEIGQGTWQMEHDRTRAVEALRRGLDLGLTHIDTAEMYGGGAVEELVRQALVGRRREEVFLVSKVLPSNASPAGTLRACEASLRRLGTDHLDLYLLHWPGAFPLEETFGAFEDLVHAGKIRAWGVSNFDVGDLERAAAVVDPARIACNQVLYHLGERHIEHGVLPWCTKRGVTVVGYSPFGSGSFPPGRPGGRGAQLLRAIAVDHGASPRQVALRFLLRVPGLLVIPKAARVEHVEDNAAAGGLQLSGAELRALEGALPAGPTKSYLPMI
jgi:diketogulonate reductase-like aldo/keto reductase